MLAAELGACSAAVLGIWLMLLYAAERARTFCCSSCSWAVIDILVDYIGQYIKMKKIRRNACIVHRVGWLVD